MIMCTDNVQVDNGQRLGCRRIDVARGKRTHTKQKNAGSKCGHWKQLESTLNMPLYQACESADVITVPLFVPDPSPVACYISRIGASVALVSDIICTMENLVIHVA
jgi:hypothetical protein